MSEIVVIDGGWKTDIIDAWETPHSGESYDTHNDDFLDTIWDKSLTSFDIPREVQVVVDNNDKLWISVGTPGFVWFETPPVGLKLPIKCWIHTHPFGKAYFSGTDWSTIRTWEPLLSEAIVLGGQEWMVWTKDADYTVFYQKISIPDWDENQTLITDWSEEE